MLILVQSIRPQISTVHIKYLQDPTHPANRAVHMYISADSGSGAELQSDAEEIHQQAAIPRSTLFSMTVVYVFFGSANVVHFGTRYHCDRPCPGNLSTEIFSM
jgi:hypothetical protein